jgi:hypothetical protein
VGGVSRFPTRQYPYRRAGAGAGLADNRDAFDGIAAPEFVRFFLGKDDRPVAIANSEILDHVNDPFATLILAGGDRPQTLAVVLALLDATAGVDAVPGQRLYRIADGGQIAWTQETADLDRHLRLVVTRHRAEEAELFISTAPPFDSPDIFLQIFAWDPKAGAYNFYERRRGIWSWAGSSWGALDAMTRGLGPFDSHVNGGPVMKELKQPWMHWHSQAAQIRDDMLAPDDPLRADAFYHSVPPTGLRGAEDLELIVRSGTARWARSRLDTLAGAGKLMRAPEFFRQILTTTTVNLTSAGEQSASLQPSDVIRLPTTFFLNTDALLDTLALPAAVSRLKVQAGLYQACVERYAVRLQDAGVTLVRDSFFAFPVPEPALEDMVILGELVRRGALSRRLAISLLMVDFSNPVFSRRREALLRYIPDELLLDGGSDLDRLFAAAVASGAGATVPDSPETAFLALWELPGDTWEAALAGKVEAYWATLGQMVQTEAGFDALFRLAESRRREFRNRPLAEFGLTLPVATALEIPTPLRLMPDGQVIAI